MRYKDITFFTQILKAKLSRSKRPLLVSWALTSRCNCRCFYCSEIKNQYRELNTSRVFQLIDELKRSGKIRFAGLAGTTVTELTRLVQSDYFDVVLTASILVLCFAKRRLN